MIAVVIGVVLMVLTILTRVNPVEGSVVRPEFLQTPLGRPILMFLLITSLPGWAGVILTAAVDPSSPIAWWIELLIFQIVGYWILGKIISIAWRHWSAKKN